MIKLPSIQSLVQQVGSIIKRFPLTVICAILLTTSFIYLTHNGWNLKHYDQYFWAKISMCSALGLSLFLATALFSEANRFSLKGKITIQIITLGIIVGYYFTIVNYEKFNLESFTQFTLYIIATHLFVAFAPFTGANKINGFWQFNKTLFLRGLLSGLYTCVLYGGIAIAFWLIDDLLHVKIQYTKYAYAWYLLAGVLNTFIFLAGMPKDIAELESDSSYPKGLKAFTQFVLLPLVTLYLLILYVYSAQIIIHWNLPKGYVSYLVISFSVLGILSLLLIYPLREMEENKWIKIFSRWFYVALYPLIVLLGVSIYNRILEYGITEHRYFILVLAIWLVFIAAYFLLSKKDNIKLIPVTLFILALITSTGPLGAFSVSHHSQKNRLEKLLIKDGILVNGKVIKTSKAIDDTDVANISSILHYMDEAHTLKMLQPWFNKNIDSIHGSSIYYSGTPDSLCSMIGIKYEPYSYYYRSNTYYNSNFTLSSDTRYYRASFSVKGFEYYTDFSYRHYISEQDGSDTASVHGYFMPGTDSIDFIPYHEPCKYALVKQGKTIAVMELYNFISALHSKSDSIMGTYGVNVPQDKFIYDMKGSDSVFYRFRFKSIEVNKIHNKYAIESLEAIILTKHL